MRAYQAVLPEMKKQNASLVAISPEVPDESLSFQEKLDLDFEVLSDHENRVAHAFGLVFRLGDDIIDIFSNTFSIELPKKNGEASWELPIPATYVIDRDRTITVAFVEPDYTKRIEPDALLAALATM
jgi:peroxiredoxin